MPAASDSRSSATAPDRFWSFLDWENIEAVGAAVYAGVEPLSADDVAECVRWVAARPSHVNIDQLVVLARDQVGARQVHRRPT